MTGWQVLLAMILGGVSVALLYNINGKVEEAVRLLRTIANAQPKPDEPTGSA